MKTQLADPAGEPVQVGLDVVRGEGHEVGDDVELAVPQRGRHRRRVVDVRRRAPCTSAGIGRLEVEPRLSTDTSKPCSTARRTHAVLITPVPPMNSARGAVMATG